MKTLTNDHILPILPRSPEPGRRPILPAASRTNILELRGTRLWRAALILGILVFFWLTFTYLWSAVLPGLLALILTSVLWPVARTLRRFLPSGLAALVTILSPLAVLAGVGLAAAPSAVTGGRGLADAATTEIAKVNSLVESLPVSLPEGAADRAVATASAWLSNNVQAVFGGLLQGIMTVGSLLVVVGLTLVFSFFMLKDGEKFLPWLSRWISKPAARHAITISEQTWRALSAYISAQAAVALIDAVLIGVALWIFDIPLALLLAVIVLLAGFVPVVGGITSGLLATGVALVSHGWATALIILAVVFVVQQLEGNLLQPALVGRRLRIHPGVVLASVVVGGTLLGVVGAFLAVPFTATAIIFLRYSRTPSVPPALTLNRQRAFRCRREALIRRSPHTRACGNANQRRLVIVTDDRTDGTHRTDHRIVNDWNTHLLIRMSLNEYMIKQFVGSGNVDSSDQ